MLIRGLIFDFDGLIIDTETTEFQAWQEIYQLFGVELPLSEWSQAVGTYPSHFDQVEYLQQLTGQEMDRAALSKRAYQRNLDLIRTQQTRPGVREYVACARKRGLKLAIASSSPFEWVNPHLSWLNLADQFDAICTREDVTEGKPAPDLYLCALKKLGLKPQEVLAFEDSGHGILAAKSAGLKCIAIPNPMTRHLPINHADHVMNSMADLSLDELMEVVGAVIPNQQ